MSERAATRDLFVLARAGVCCNALRDARNVRTTCSPLGTEALLRTLDALLGVSLIAVRAARSTAAACCTAWAGLPHLSGAWCTFAVIRSAMASAWRKQPVLLRCSERLVSVAARIQYSYVRCPGLGRTVNAQLCVQPVP